MNIILFCINNWSDITIIVSILASLIVFLRRGEEEFLRNIGLNFVTEAQRLYGSDVGILKKTAVLEWLYDKIPYYLRPFFSDKRLGKLIDNVILPAAKEYWAKNPAIQEYIGVLKVDGKNI